MSNSLRKIVTATAVCLCGLVALLPAWPANAGLNRWTAIGPAGSHVIAPDVGLLAVDPTAPSTIYTNVGGRVAKTIDGGMNWEELVINDSWRSIELLMIDPSSPSTLYAAHGVLYKSTDAGAHWAPAFNNNGIWKLVIAPSRSSTVYAISFQAGVIKTSDGGSSVERVNNGLPYGGIDAIALAVDPTNPDVAYAAIREYGSNSDEDPGFIGIFKSTNGGTQWRAVSVIPPPFITSLVIDPATPSTLYGFSGFFSDLRVLKSSDSGETWVVLQNGLGTGAGVRALAIDPSAPSNLYAATQNGVYRSGDAAGSWLPFNFGLETYDVFDIAIDRTGTLLRAVTASGLYEYQASWAGKIGAGITGSWYDSAQNGHGIFVQVLPGQRFYAAWFAFDPGGTQQAWFTGVGTYSGNTAGITAVEQPIGGRWIPNFEPNQIVHIPWGTLTFTFTDCNHGRVDFNSVAGYGAGSMNLMRLTQPGGLTCP